MSPDDMAMVIADLQSRIRNAATQAGRDPGRVRIVGVGKTVSAERIEAGIRAGLAIVAESYIQEARDKHPLLSRHPISFHFIGHLQSNKAKYAVRMFDLIHSVDSAKLAEALDREAEKFGKVQDILIQVNIGDEASKSGVAIEDALPLARSIGALPHLKLHGLMAIPPVFDSPEEARPAFRALRLLAEEIAAEAIPNVAMTELSMGMSGDFEAAVEEGATLVRIGTRLFGDRP